MNFLCSVPAAVVSLKAQSGNQSDALYVKWDQGPGDLNGYLVTLCNPNGSQQARTQLDSKASMFVFSDLVPGRLYRVEVLSLSGELSNAASTLGRTGENTITTIWTRLPVSSTGIKWSCCNLNYISCNQKPRTLLGSSVILLYLPSIDTIPFNRAKHERQCYS